MNYAENQKWNKKMNLLVKVSCIASCAYTFLDMRIRVFRSEGFFKAWEQCKEAVRR